MRLDVTTLSLVTVFVTALLGALLVFAGVQNRSIRAPMWWGFAYVVGAVGVALVASRNGVPAFLSIDIGNALVLLGYGLVWSGARVFDGRKVRPGILLLAPVLWLVLCRVPAFAADVNLRVIVGSTMLAALATLTAEEFWRGRAEPLMSRWPTVIVLLAYSAVLLARIPGTVLSPFLDNGSFVGGVSFALLAFGALVCTVVLAFLLLNMTKERTELKHKIDASIDSLTGLSNRRAFLDGAAELVRRQANDPRRSPCCCSTWTGSRRSTTASAMRSATARWRCSRAAPPGRSAPGCCSGASAARNSPPCSRWASAARPRRSPNGSGAISRSRRRSSVTCARPSASA
jgi:hypothetical protein